MGAGLSTWSVITLIFAAMNLFGIVHVSWWTVFLFWIAPALLYFTFAVVLGGLIGGFIGRLF